MKKLLGKVSTKLKLLLKTRTVTPVKSEYEEDWDMLPDVEDLEKIVQRELKKLEEWEIANTTKE